MSAPQPGVEQFVDRVRQLYSLPAVAVEVLRLTEGDDVDIQAIRRSIENDPALTTKILRVVNSSLFGTSTPVVDLQQALAMLGIKPLKLLVLSFSLSGELFSGATGKIVGRYWRHALTQAIAARELAEKLPNIPGDEAFTAALLKDLGMLVLIQEIGHPYVRLVERILESRGHIIAMERSALGFDHVQLTAGLLARWNLPAGLVSAIAEAGELSQAEPTSADACAKNPSTCTLAGVLETARRVADLLVDQRYDRLQLLLSDSVGGVLISESDLDALVTELETKVGRLADVLSLELPVGSDYRDILVEGHARLSETAVEVAAELACRHPQDGDCDRAEAIQSDVEELSTALEKLTHHGRSASASPAAAAAAGTTLRMDASSAGRTIPRGRATVVLGGELDLRSRLLAAVSSCRQARCALSLILVEMDRFEDVVYALGPVEALKVVSRLSALCVVGGSTEQICMQMGEARFALVLPGCDRDEAVAIADALVRRSRVALASAAEREGQISITVSAGVATVVSPAKNFWPAQLSERAASCLRAAQSSGGSTVKSIGIY